MKILWFTLTEWIALFGVLSGAVFGLMKFYNLLMSLNSTVERLNETLNSLDTKYNDHERRIVILEQQSKTLFKTMGGRK